jgi:biopolymer transport protein ExbD
VRLHRAKREYGCEINIAPLIDVVFLLIIFFLTVSHITQVRVEALLLPQATEIEKPQQPLSSNVIINVHKEGRIVVSGKSYDIDSLESMLRAEQANSSSGGLSILLRGDREALWARISEIMRILSKLGLNQIRVAVIESGESDQQAQE